MSLPTPPKDTTRLASETDKLQALASLATLPAPRSFSEEQDEINDKAMMDALGGVTRYALGEAVRSILRGALGHTFFPSPVELRRLCDEAQRPHSDYQRRVRITEEQQRERDEFNRIQASKTPEALARSRALWEQARARLAPDKEPEPRLTLDPELVAKVPDAPSTFKRAPKVA